MEEKVPAQRSGGRNRPSIQIIEHSSCNELLHLLRKEQVVLFIIRYADGRIADLSKKALAILQYYGVQASIYDVTDATAMEHDIQRFSGWQYFPQLFVRAEFIGGSMILDEFFASGEFTRMTGIATLERRNDSAQPHDDFAQRAFWRISVAAKNNVVACVGANGLAFGQVGKGTALSRRSSHSGWANAVCFAAGERRIITAGTDCTIRILDILTGEESVIFEAHRRWINDLTSIPDSPRVVSASADRTLGLWDSASASLLVKSAPAETAFWCICALKSGYKVASGDANGRLSFYNAHDLSFEYSIEAHNNCIAVIVPDWSDSLFSASYDGLVKWIGTEGIRYVFLGHRARVWSVAALPDDRLAAGAADSRILIWRRDKQFPIHEIRMSETPLTMVWWPLRNCLLIGTSAGNLWRVDPNIAADPICLT